MVEETKEQIKNQLDSTQKKLKQADQTITHLKAQLDKPNTADDRSYKHTMPNKFHGLTYVIYPQDHLLRFIGGTATSNWSDALDFDWNFDIDYDIHTVIFDKAVDLNSVTDFSYCIQNDEVQRVIFLTNITDGNLTNMEGMFTNATSLKEVQFPPIFNTSNVRNMSYLFDGCHYLKKLDLSSFDTSSVLTMNRMFNDDVDLTSLKLPHNFNTFNAVDLGYMFWNTGLSKIDLPDTVNTKETVILDGMFGSNNHLKEVSLPSSFSMHSVSHDPYIFAQDNHLRYVKSPTAPDFVNFKGDSYDDDINDHISLVHSKGNQNG